MACAIRSTKLAEKRRSESQAKRPYPGVAPVLALLFLAAVKRPRRHDLDDAVAVRIFRRRFHAQVARGEGGVRRRSAGGLEEQEPRSAVRRRRRRERCVWKDCRRWGREGSAGARGTKLGFCRCGASPIFYPLQSVTRNAGEIRDAMGQV
jgi:hypothetical protein